MVGDTTHLWRKMTMMIMGWDEVGNIQIIIDGDHFQEWRHKLKDEGYIMYKTNE